MTRVAWHRRIGVRLALLIASALIVFELAAPYLHEFAGRAIGLPDSELTLAVLDTSWIHEELLENGEAPTAKGIARVAEDLDERGVAFVWLDPTAKIVARSPGLPWNAGDDWPFSIETTQSIPLGSRRAGATITRVADGERELGKFVSILSDPKRHAEEHASMGDTPEDIEECWFCSSPDTRIIDEAEFMRTLEWDERLALLLTIGLTVGCALLIGFVSSKWITGRITRMAEQIGAREGDELPGPFDERTEDEVGSLARAMNEMRAGIASRDEERREWIAQVSHDLRTPLTALIACLDRVQSAIGADHTAAEVVEVARRDAQRVQSLAEDLLEIARLDAEIGMRREPVPPGELVRRVVEELEPIATSEGVALKIELEPNLPILDADGNRLLRTLENLIRNAVRHAKSFVLVGARRDGDAIEFGVSDDGDGFRIDTSKIGLDPSAGLGLVVARRAVEAHGGTISATSGSVGGAVVSFRIPTAPAG